MMIKIALLLVFFAVMITVGVLCRRSATDVNGFVLGGRSVGPWLTAFAYGTSYFSAVIFIGYAGQFGWKFGLASTWIGIGNAILGSLLAWVILGRRTRLMTQHLGSATMPEFFEKRYLSKNLKIVAAVIIFVFMIPYTASLYNGLSRLFSMAFSIDYSVCIVVMALLTAVYVIVGGYMATAVNDFIQGIIMLFGIVAVIAAVLSQNGGLMGSIAGLAEVADPALEYGSVPGIFVSMFGPDPINLLAVVLLTSLGTWGLPQMVGKFYAIKSEKAIGKGTIISTLFAVVVAGGCYFLGGFGRLFYTPGENSTVIFDDIIPTMLENLPDLLMAVVVILVLSASMSTLSSLVLTSSSTVTIDLIKPLSKNFSEKKQLITLRFFIAVFVIISAVIALLQHMFNISSIAQLMGISWGALAGAFLAPFLYGLYWKRTTRAACWVSFGFSVVVMIANMLARSAFPTIIQSPVNCGAFVMLVSLVLVPVVSLLTPAPKQDAVDGMFTCYDVESVAPAKEHLGK
ncbi:MAG: sodium/solute symporter [Clostridia bacterium]|nr:sodium/solute symporter [Clostridia bacterium]